MVRILGNSTERVPIHDLGDVIYYKQTKDYTDQEFEKSKDIKREITKGRLIILDKFKTPRNPVNDDSGSKVTINQHTSVDLETIKKAVKEVLPEAASSPKSAMDVIKEAIPMLISTVRQEMSSLISVGPKVSASSSNYQGPEYVPDISTDGMISHVKPEEKEVDGSDTASTLEALRRLKKSK